MIEQQLKGLRILIIEDSAGIAMDVSSGFRMAGARTVEVKASMRQAKKRLAEEPLPDIALIDYNIVGEETGLDLALWMRSQSTLSHILRILYSGSDMANVRAKLPDSDVFHQMIAKPAPLAVLIQQIADVVHQYGAT